MDIEPGNSNRIKLQFLGKDSMMYENTFEVDPVVHDLVMGWVSGDAKGKSKRPNDPLFDAFSAGDLNQYLGKCMVGLTAKVFRTFNASATLDRLLVESERRMDENTNLEAKLAAYNMANKEVAILCNHQRSVPKGHAQQMAKLDESIQKAEEELKKAEDELEAMQEDKEYVKKGGKNNKVEAARKRVNQKREKLGILKSRRTVRENLKTVALGTSKVRVGDTGPTNVGMGSGRGRGRPGLGLGELQRSAAPRCRSTTWTPASRSRGASGTRSLWRRSSTGPCSPSSIGAWTWSPSFDSEYPGPPPGLRDALGCKAPLHMYRGHAGRALACCAAHLRSRSVRRGALGRGAAIQSTAPSRARDLRRCVRSLVNSALPGF